MPSAPDVSDPLGPFDREVSIQEVADRIATVPIDGSPADMRRAYEWLLRGTASGTTIPVGRPARVGQVQGWAFPPGDGHAAPDVEIRSVWFHGGGYVFGSPETHWRAVATYAAALGETVFVPRYQLAPEALWPAPLQAGLDVCRAILDRGLRLSVCGDSAGGHLTLTTALALARENRQPTVAAVLSPNADRTGLSDTREPNSETDAMNNDEDDRRCASISTGPLDVPDDDVTISPLVDDLSLLPPIHIEVGGTEVLLGEARILAERAREAGVQASLHVEPDAFHMWQLWAPWLPEATASIERAAAFVRGHLDA